VHSVAAIPLLSSLAERGTGNGVSPRILAAVAVAVSLHGVLLLGNGTGTTAPTFRSQSLAVRFIATSAEQTPTTATSVLQPSTSTATATLSKPEPGQRSAREARLSVDRTTEKPASPSRPTKGPTVSGSAQSVAPVAPSSESSAEPSRRALADAPDYLLAKLLTVGPRPLEDIEPKYPDAADLRTGTVVLRLLIGDTGHVDDVAVVRANPPGLFDASAMDAFAKARFSPGLVGGVAVKSQMTVEVEFVPLNRLSRISGRSY